MPPDRLISSCGSWQIGYMIMRIIIPSENMSSNYIDTIIFVNDLINQLGINQGMPLQFLNYSFTLVLQF